MLAMSGRVTMLGISRWALSGGSYRTVIRFFRTVIPWATVFWVFFRRHLFCPNDVYLLAGDEVVISQVCIFLMISFTVGIVSYFVQSIYQNHSSIVPRIIQGILKFNTQGWAEEQNPTFARLFYK
jgi:hypothetical protein